MDKPAMPSITKFSFTEAFNNSKGKTAMPLICGFAMVITGCIMSLWSTYTKYGEGLAAGSGLAFTGAGLLGIRRFTKDKDILTVDSGTENTDNTKKENE